MDIKYKLQFIFLNITDLFWQNNVEEINNQKYFAKNNHFFINFFSVRFVLYIYTFACYNNILSLILCGKNLFPYYNLYE